MAVPAPTARRYSIMAELWSLDNDFDRFPGLRWQRPSSDS